MSEPTLFVRRDSEGQRSEGSTPSFIGHGLGLRAPKRTLSELGVLPSSLSHPLSTQLHWCLQRAGVFSLNAGPSVVLDIWEFGGMEGT